VALLHQGWCPHEKGKCRQSIQREQHVSWRKPSLAKKRGLEQPSGGATPAIILILNTWVPDCGELFYSNPRKQTHSTSTNYSFLICKWEVLRERLRAIRKFNVIPMQNSSHAVSSQHIRLIVNTTFITMFSMWVISQIPLWKSKNLYRSLNRINES
jgi:hypothetical protein